RLQNSDSCQRARPGNSPALYEKRLRKDSQARGTGAAGAGPWRAGPGGSGLRFSRRIFLEVLVVTAHVEYQVAEHCAQRVFGCLCENEVGSLGEATTDCLHYFMNLFVGESVEDCHLVLEKGMVFVAGFRCGVHRSLRNLPLQFWPSYVTYHS